MPLVTPGKRVGLRLAKSRVFGKGAHGRKAIFADLLITPLVDMFVIIVIFLLQNFSATGDAILMTKDISLPEAANGSAIERSPAVQVSNDAVMLEGEQIALVADLARDEYWNIPALEEKLRDLKKRYEYLHQSDAAAGFKGEVNIQANRDVPFKALKRVMYSCNMAGYFNLNFAVMQTGAAPNAEARTAGR